MEYDFIIWIIASPIALIVLWCIYGRNRRSSSKDTKDIGIDWAEFNKKRYKIMSDQFMGRRKFEVGDEVTNEITGLLHKVVGFEGKCFVRTTLSEDNLEYAVFPGGEPIYIYHEDDLIPWWEGSKYYDPLGHFNAYMNLFKTKKYGYKMNKKLKIKLYNEGNIVIYRVLEQCESLRKLGKFESKSGFLILSATLPHIETGRLYLRGTDKERDDAVSMLNFENEQSAKEYIKKCLEALQEFADNNYFDGKSDTIEDIDIINDEGVYEF